MSNDFARRGAAVHNEIKQSLGELVGIATGLLADQALADTEIRFLHAWMTTHEAIASIWPGDIIYARLKAVLADGVITSEERAYLVETLQQLIGSTTTDAAEPTHITGLAFNDTDAVVFQDCAFCLTGDFVYAEREVCEAAILQRGGLVKSGISKKVRYVVVGSRGSAEWKHGSFGTKIAKAIELQRTGAPILIIEEERWATAL
jgi:NAD-dependent DNA ligase